MDYFSMIQQGINTLLMTREPEFIRFGNSLFTSLATIVIAWQGITMMFSGENLSEMMFRFAKTILFVSIGFAMIVFYESPIPGFGSSFSNLITDQMKYFETVLDTSSVQSTFEHLDAMGHRFLEPSVINVLASITYFAVMLVIVLAKAAALLVVAFGMIASAVCGLLGPLFVPFFIVPQLDWIFWGWLKAFIQFSFIPTVAYAYLMIFERFLFQVLTNIPPGVTADLYSLHVIQVLVVLATFIVGLLLVPSLTAALFSGTGAGLSVLPAAITWRGPRARPPAPTAT